jgi:hypothetical protein
VCIPKAFEKSCGRFSLRLELVRCYIHKC